VAQQLLGQPAAAARSLLLFQLIDQIYQVEEAPPGAGTDGLDDDVIVDRNGDISGSLPKAFRKLFVDPLCCNALMFA
jgi:hypothetical protein